MARGNKLGRISLFTGCCAGILAGCLLVTGCDKLPLGEKPAAEKAATENPTTRMTFSDLFDVNGNMVTPKKILRYGSTTMTPEVPFEIQVMRFNDTPFSQYIGHDAEVKKEGDLYRIIQFY